MPDVDDQNCPALGCASYGCWIAAGIQTREEAEPGIRLKDDAYDHSSVVVGGMHTEACHLLIEEALVRICSNRDSHRIPDSLGWDEHDASDEIHQTIGTFGRL